MITWIDQEKTRELPKLENSFALDIKQKLNNIQYKLAEDTFNWTVKIQIIRKLDILDVFRIGKAESEISAFLFLNIGS